MTYWMNGEFAEKPGAVSITDRGFLLGDGVFETLLAAAGTPIFWHAHINRLRKGLEALQIKAPLDALSLELVRELAIRNDLEKTNTAVRLTVTRGPGARGLLAPPETNPTMLLTMAPYSQLSNKLPMRLCVSQFRRSEHSITARHKTLNYLDNTLARNEADGCGADDAVMLNSAGRVAGVSAGNIFAISSERELITPPVGEGALPGVVRQQILTHAEAAGVSIIEAPIEQRMLEKASLLVSNSLMGVRQAVLTGNDSSTPHGDLQIIHRLQSCYQTIVDQDVASRTGER